MRTDTKGSFMTSLTDKDAFAKENYIKLENADPSMWLDIY